MFDFNLFLSNNKGALKNARVSWVMVGIIK